MSYSPENSEEFQLNSTSFLPPCQQRSRTLISVVKEQIQQLNQDVSIKNVENKWKDLNLEGKSKLLIKDNSFSLGNVGEALYLKGNKSKLHNFYTEDPLMKVLPPDYRPLSDPYVGNFYKSGRNRKRLLHLGSISANNRAMCTPKDYRRFFEYMKQMEGFRIREEELKGNAIDEKLKKQITNKPLRSTCLSLPEVVTLKRKELMDLYIWMQKVWCLVGKERINQRRMRALAIKREEDRLQKILKKLILWNKKDKLKSSNSKDNSTSLPSIKNFKIPSRFHHYDTPSLSNLSAEIDELLKKGLPKFHSNQNDKKPKLKKKTKRNEDKRSKFKKLIDDQYSNLSASLKNSNSIVDDKGSKLSIKDDYTLQKQWRDISSTIVEWIIYSVTDLIIPLCLGKTKQSTTRRSISPINKDSDNMKRNVSFNKIIKVAESKSCNSELSDNIVDDDRRTATNEFDDDLPSSQLGLRSRDSLELLRNTSSYLAVHPNEAGNALLIVSKAITAGLLKSEQIHRLFNCVADTCPKLDKLALDELLNDQSNDTAINNLASSVLHSTLARNIKIIQIQEKDENFHSRPRGKGEENDDNDDDDNNNDNEEQESKDDILLAQELRSITKNCFKVDNSDWKVVAIDFLAHAFRQVYAYYLKDKKETTREDIREYLMDHIADMYLESSPSIYSENIMILIEKFTNLQNNWSLRLGCPLHSRKIDSDTVNFIKTSLMNAVTFQEELISKIIDYSLNCSITTTAVDEDNLLRVSGHIICNCKPHIAKPMLEMNNYYQSIASSQGKIKNRFEEDRDLYVNSISGSKKYGPRWRKRFSSSAGSGRSRESTDDDNKINNENNNNNNNNNKKFFNFFKRQRSVGDQRSRMNSLRNSVEGDFQVFRRKSICKDSENQIDIISSNELKRFSTQSDEKTDSLRSNDFVVVQDTDIEQQLIIPVFQGKEIEGLDENLCSSGLSAVTVKNGLTQNKQHCHSEDRLEDRLSYVNILRPELSLHYLPETFNKELATDLIKRSSIVNQEKCMISLNTTRLPVEEKFNITDNETDEKVLSVINLESEENTENESRSSKRLSLRLIRKTIETLYENSSETSNNNNNNNNNNKDKEKEKDDKILCNLLPAYQPIHVRARLYRNFGKPLYDDEITGKFEDNSEISQHCNENNPYGIRLSLEDFQQTYDTDNVGTVQPVFKGQKLEIDSLTAGLALGVISYKDFNHSQTPYATVERISHTNLHKPDLSANVDSGKDLAIVLQRIEAAAAGYKKLLVQAGLYRKTLYDNRMSLDDRRKESLENGQNNDDKDANKLKSNEEMRRFSDITPLIESAKRTLDLAKVTDQSISNMVQKNSKLRQKYLKDDSSSDEGKTKKITIFNSIDEKNTIGKQEKSSSIKDK
ncbi:DgyrCDS8998 [Dimorphilus gyrociliatus]|uniref:DgyrCDS8998 n=1 Tax=Dimorphilus gyrociliatus TaxID=2664684 RepID=A0A7I8VXA6_9ANNE|nr:DgyrCDS8998 [Dimorphilus gyrociliatus]